MDINQMVQQLTHSRTIITKHMGGRQFLFTVHTDQHNRHGLAQQFKRKLEVEHTWHDRKPIDPTCYIGHHLMIVSSLGRSQE